MSQRYSTSDKVFEEKHKIKDPTSLLEESGVATAIHDDGELLLPGIRQKAEKTLLRKLDTRLLPTILLVFILNYIDVSSRTNRTHEPILIVMQRTAISSARLYGIEQDVHITGIRPLAISILAADQPVSTDIQYETVLAVLYASYVPAQIPSNMILNRISRCAFVWMLQGVAAGLSFL